MQHSGSAEERILIFFSKAEVDYVFLLHLQKFLHRVM